MSEGRNIPQNPLYKYILYLLLIMWGIHSSKVLFGFSYNGWGLYPRQLFGASGVLSAPLIHQDWSHLINNSIPFLVVGLMMSYFYKRVAIKSFVIIYVLTGLLVWLFARESWHIGASGVVYGMVAFVFWTGVFRRSIRSIALSLVIFLLYSSMIAGVFPIQKGVSWESHLLGGIVGIFVAYIFREEIEEDDKPNLASWEHEEENRRAFLDSDTFEFTKEQRRAETRENQWNQDDTL